jgi:proteic killer suppression protein
MKRNKVIISKQAHKDIQTIPQYITKRLYSWIRFVEKRGLIKVRMTPGYHDEPLHGDRAGQRSFRLNRSYRAFYVISIDSTELMEIVIVKEVNKHGY